MVKSAVTKLKRKTIKMDQAQNPKQQIVEKLKNANNVLVTVSSSPSVDQLAAAIGLALMLDKLDKHATAVYSGETPNAIEFLNPEGTLHKNTDSLQDFIISLDASKADKLRYKREGDIAKIFITPYKTSITQDDLSFSQGDVNVDAVVALGVDQREHLDQAIVSHGRILHDATVMTMMAGPGQSNIGSINWQDQSASSLSEMIVSISEAFQSGLIDAQIATAFLTGIVSETDRFKNNKTTPKVMTMSAQLMSAGANQQLIADNLSQPEPEPEPEPEPDVIKEDAAEAVNEEPVKEVNFQNDPVEKPKKSQSGDVLSFNMHDLDGDVAYGNDAKQDDDGIEFDLHADKIHIDNEGNMKPEDLPEEQPSSDDVQPPAPEPQPQPESYDQNQPFKNDVIASTGTVEETEPKDETNSNPAEGGESFALHKGMKVIQPLPPEPPQSTPDVPATESNERTINDIEERVGRNQDQQPAPDEQAVIEAAEPVSQDTAREHVEQAINADFDAPPKPIEALNAMPLEDGQAQDPNQDESNPEDTAPPLPPPPFDPNAGGQGMNLPPAQ